MKKQKKRLAKLQEDLMSLPPDVRKSFHLYLGTLPRIDNQKLQTIIKATYSKMREMRREEIVAVRLDQLEARVTRLEAVKTK